MAANTYHVAYRLGNNTKYEWFPFIHPQGEVFSQQPDGHLRLTSEALGYTKVMNCEFKYWYKGIVLDDPQKFNIIE